MANTAQKVQLKNVRLSFPNLFKRGNFNGEETKYEATFILDAQEHKDTIAKLNGLIAECVKELKVKKLGDDRLCLKDGDDFDRPEYEGKFTLKAASNSRPLVIDRDKTPVAEEDNVVYAGCYVNAIVSLWIQDNKWGKRVNANLHGVQFFKDGEPFGDSKVDVDDFDAFDDEDDFDDIV